MILKKIAFLSLLFTFLAAKSQSFSISGDVSFKPSIFSAVDLDKSSLNVYYQTRFVKDVKSPSKITEAFSELEIGSKFSKFSDINTFKQDSLDETFSKLTVVTAKEINLRFRYEPKWRVILLKNTEQQTVTVQDYAKNKYEYEELQPHFNWKLLENKTKTILGYQCFSATTSFRGRNYTAWFTKDLPINNGPYIFQGLPGLILEIYDDENNFSFSAIGMDKKPKSIYWRTEKRIIKTSRSKFKEVQQTYHDKPGLFHGKAYDPNGEELKLPGRPLPYNPIEKE